MVYICTVSVNCCFFFFKQKTAYEMRISDWSSDVCSSDLWRRPHQSRPAASQILKAAPLNQMAADPTSAAFQLRSPVMSTLRTLRHVMPSVATSDGAGVKLRRSIGSQRGLYLDPFQLGSAHV